MSGYTPTRPDPKSIDDLVLWLNSEFEQIANCLDEVTEKLRHFNVGNGAPNGVVTADTGSIYVDLAGGAGATLWVKETSPLPNTGWVAK